MHMTESKRKGSKGQQPGTKIKLPADWGPSEGWPDELPGVSREQLRESERRSGRRDDPTGNGGRQSPNHLADVLIRNCVGYCLDADEAAITLLLAAKTLQPEAFLQLAQVVEENFYGKKPPAAGEA